MSFWCIYLVSLAHEQFIKGARYRDLLDKAGPEIVKFRRDCADARIPEIEAKKSLERFSKWALHVLTLWRPRRACSSWRCRRVRGRSFWSEDRQTIGDDR